MTGIRLRLRCGYRTDVVEVPAEDTLLGSASECGVIIPNAAPRQAWLLPRRGRLLLTPVAHAVRRPAIDGVRVEAPVVLGAGQMFRLGDVEVLASRVDSCAPAVSAVRAGWRLRREVGAEGVEPRIYLADGPDGPGRIYGVHRPSDAWLRRTQRVDTLAPSSDGLWWATPGLPGFTLDTLVASHRQGAILWPVEAAVVVITQLAEALCAHHDAFGAHGALRPELLLVDIEGRISLVDPGPEAIDWDYQPESVRLGGPATEASDLFGWWRLTRWLALRFTGPSDEIPLWARAPTTRAELLTAAESVRRWAVDGGLDPSAVHVARGVRLAMQASPLGWTNEAR